MSASLHHRHANHHGFTLIELSIVLIIIGLITGGIMTGSSLIHNAEIRGVITQTKQLADAIQMFEEKYKELPGDMSNATTLWGTATNCPGNQNQASTDKTTCDGDGDGIIEGNSTVSNEAFRAWQHLVNAGFLEGTFTGVRSGSTNDSAQPGLNIPEASIDGIGFTLWHLDLPAGDSENFGFDYGNHFLIGMDSGNNDPADAPAFPPKDARSIDEKMDDGMPAMGRVIATHWDNCTLADDEVDYEKGYDLTEKRTECGLRIKDIF